MRVSGKHSSILLSAAILLSCASLSDRGTNKGFSQPAEEDQGAPQFVVTEDLYKQTFSEIEELVTMLNEIIQAKDFDEWVRHLSPDYIAKTSSPEFLHEASMSPMLQKDHVTLTSLKDYFLAVVVPSRVQATLHDISFIDETHVKAITIINGNPAILYLLVRVDADWMIGIW